MKSFSNKANHKSDDLIFLRAQNAIMAELFKLSIAEEVVSIYKLDGVQPVDLKSSTDELISSYISDDVCESDDESDEQK